MTPTTLARQALERLSRNRSFERHLPPDLGAAPIIVSPDASLRFWHPRLQSDLFDFAREFVRPGDTVWDIGANVGLLTIAAAHRAGPSGKVFAVEADLWLNGLLRRSAQLQPPAAAPIRILPAAASDTVGIASFNIASRGRATNFLSTVEGSSQTGGIRATVDILSITLDWLLEQSGPPSVIKIDVEGAEALVFAGATRTIAEARPVILVEVHDPSADRITETLHNNGYTLFDWDAPGRPPVPRACFNTLALPPR